MKILLYTITIVTLIGCNSTTKKETTSIDKTSTYNPELEVVDEKGYNTLVKDTVDGGEMYLGKINYTGLQRDFAEAWFNENYKNHTIDTLAIKKLTNLLPTTNIKVFMGTWCEDSQREVPALSKIFKATSHDLDDLELIAVTHDKDTPQGFEKDLDIEYVPTIIFYRDGKEINRIVEYAHGTLEQDMVTILEGKAYKHAYAE